MEPVNPGYDISNESSSLDSSMESTPLDNPGRNEHIICNSIATNATTSNSEHHPDGELADSTCTEQSSSDELVIIPSSKEDDIAKNLSSDELTFDDWHFVDKSVNSNISSDDESIEIIEREISRQDDFTTSENESENEQENHNGTLPSSSESSIADKNIQTIEMQSECYSLVELQSRPVPTQVTELRVPFWLYHYMILCTIIASLCFLHRITAPLYGPWRSNTYQNSANDVNVPFTGNVSPDESPALMDYLQENIKLKKAIFDDIFARQVELLKHLKHFKNNLYVLNVSEFAQKKSKSTSLPKHKSIFNLLNSDDELLLCDYDVEVDKLPNVCQDNQDILLLLHENQLISVYDSIGNFFQDSYDNYNNLDDSILMTLTRKPLDKFEKNAKDANSFVQDCDSFSKNYRPNFCSKTNPENCVDSCSDTSESAVEDENVQPFDTNENTFNFDTEFMSAETNANRRGPDVADGETAWTDLEKDNGADGGSDEDRKSRKVVQELRHFIAKFKRDFESLYQSYVEADELEVYESRPNEFKIKVSVDNVSRNVTRVENSSGVETAGSEAPPPADSNDSKVISGEWWFNLNAARAKLRDYYERAVSGDWILKLGKAREKLRRKFQDSKEKFEKNFNKERKHDSRGRKYWYKKAPEKLKNDFKKFTSKWKSHFKKMKHGILEKYEKYVPSDWQFHIKNMWSF